jgi:hypothetical protein
VTTHKARNLDTPSRARYGGTMTPQRNGGLAMLGAALVLVSAVGCRQPRPTYEYGETETTITTTPAAPVLTTTPPAAVVTTSTLAPKSPTWKRGESR